MENMANWGYLRYRKSSPNTRKVFKRIRRIRGKNLCVHREDANRLLAYSPNTPKRHKSVYISVNNNTNFFWFFLSTLCGMDQAKKTSHATVPLIEFIDWRYRRLYSYFRPLLWTIAALTFSLVHLPHSPVSLSTGVCIYSVCNGGGGAGIGLCGAYTGVIHCVYDKIPNLKK